MNIKHSVPGFAFRVANVLNSLGMEHFIIGEMSARQDLSRLIPFPSVQVLLIDLLSRQICLLRQ